MVVAIFIIMLILLIVVDIIVKKEDRSIKESEKSVKSPIFLSPDKALRELPNESDRRYHPSHSWILHSAGDLYYAGYDKFISGIFPSEIRVSVYPQIDDYVRQGEKIWSLHFNGHSITQLAPITGKIIDVNPAFKMELPLPAEKIAKSWIIKLKAFDVKNETNNLLNHEQASSVNNMLMDSIVMNAEKEHYLNDGGVIDPAYIKNIDDNEWKEFNHKFFPYQEGTDTQ
jgi:glycine cleavage system H lipoate-binding protein